VAPQAQRSKITKWLAPVTLGVPQVDGNPNVLEAKAPVPHELAHLLSEPCTPRSQDAA
jgi:hypothetical protein